MEQIKHRAKIRGNSKAIYLFQCVHTIVWSEISTDLKSEFTLRNFQVCVMHMYIQQLTISTHGRKLRNVHN